VYQGIQETYTLAPKMCLCPSKNLSLKENMSNFCNYLYNRNCTCNYLSLSVSQKDKNNIHLCVCYFVGECVVLWSKMATVRSKRDKAKLVDNNFVYVFEKSSKNGERGFWICEKRGECKARAWTEMETGNVTYRSEGHTHAPDRQGFVAFLYFLI
jgi:hypothetical protein